MREYQDHEKACEETSKICGYQYEQLGGWNLGWYIPLTQKKNDKGIPERELIFGFANGPLGYSYSTNFGEDFPDGADMEKEEATPEEMAEFIKKTVEKFSKEK